MIAAIRPVLLEGLIFWYRWALHDLQRKNPAHPDLPFVVLRLRQLLDERAARPVSIIRRAYQWL